MREAFNQLEAEKLRLQELRLKFAPTSLSAWTNKKGTIGIGFPEYRTSVSDAVLARADLPWTPQSLADALTKKEAV